MEQFSFQSLHVYKEAKSLVKTIYSLFSTFPTSEKYALCDQMRRAAVSVPSNIAEGVSRISVKERIHFIEISYGSLMEVLCQTEIVLELGYIKSKQYQETERKIIIIAKLLSGLRNSFKLKLKG